jgi:hypothetical protein
MGFARSCSDCDQYQGDVHSMCFGSGYQGFQVGGSFFSHAFGRISRSTACIGPNALQSERGTCGYSGDTITRGGPPVRYTKGRDRHRRIIRADVQNERQNGQARQCQPAAPATHAFRFHPVALPPQCTTPGGPEALTGSRCRRAGGSGSVDVPLGLRHLWKAVCR